MKKHPASAMQRFLSQISQDESVTYNGSPCWLWTGNTHALGYGVFSPGPGHSCYAHKFIWEATSGKVPENGVVRRLCPQQLCVNPAHREVRIYIVDEKRREEASRIVSICKKHGVRKIPAGAKCRLSCRQCTGERVARRYAANVVCKPKPDIIKKFHARVDRSGPVTVNQELCWTWIGKRSETGKPLFHCTGRGKSDSAEHFIWEYQKGAIPEGHVLDHVCGDIHCVNPAHFELVTREVFAERKRARFGPPICKKHKVAKVPVGTQGAIYCRQCSREWGLARYDKIRKKPRRNDGSLPPQPDEANVLAERAKA